MFPLILIGFGLLLIAAASAPKRPGEGPKNGGELPAELATTFELIGGQLVYRPEIASVAIRALHYRYGTPAPDGAAGVLIVSPGPGTPIGPENWGAYWALQGLHEQGFDIWVPMTFHTPAQMAHAVMYLKPGEAEQAKYAGYARLIGASNPWPETTP